MERSKTVLVGDIGGTNVRFSLAERSGPNRFSLHNFVKWPGEKFPTLLSAITAYVDTLDQTPRHMCFAVAGPVNHGQVTLTNRNWSLSETEIAQTFKSSSARIFNDFTAMTRSIPLLSTESFDVVHDGEALRNEPILVAGPGTGFGVGYLVPAGKNWRVVPTEGGHVAFAPKSQFEMDLLQYLALEYEFVSLELITSGSGLAPVHKAICALLSQPYEPIDPAEIRRRADRGDPVCRRVCTLRSEVTMGAIADLALAGGARGGVVLAGGVSERMIDWLTKPESLACFFNRGPRSDYVKNIPIRLLKDPQAPLLGAAALYQDTQSSEDKV